MTQVSQTIITDINGNQHIYTIYKTDFTSPYELRKGIESETSQDIYIHSYDTFGEAHDGITQELMNDEIDL